MRKVWRDEHQAINSGYLGLGMEEIRGKEVTFLHYTSSLFEFVIMSIFFHFIKDLNKTS